MIISGAYLKPTFSAKSGNHTDFTVDNLVQYAESKGYTLVQPSRGSHYGVQDADGKNVTFLTVNNSHVSLDKLKSFMGAVDGQRYTNKTAKEAMRRFLGLT